MWGSTDTSACSQGTWEIDPLTIRLADDCFSFLSYSLCIVNILFLYLRLLLSYLFLFFFIFFVFDNNCGSRFRFRSLYHLYFITLKQRFIHVKATQILALIRVLTVTSVYKYSFHSADRVTKTDGVKFLGRKQTKTTDKSYKNQV